MIKRIFDFTMAFFATVILIIPMIFVALMIKLTSKGPILYWSRRVGRHNKIFMMPKFRTMITETPVVATHLLGDPSQYLTLPGKLLRKSSIDELPQLYNIIVGEMSFVGPRPALYNQDNLISLRTVKGVHILTPGLTGWAQINGRDELPIPTKVEYDEFYLVHRSFIFDLRIITRTMLKVVMREGVSH